MRNKTSGACELHLLKHIFPSRLPVHILKILAVSGAKTLETDQLHEIHGRSGITNPSSVASVQRETDHERLTALKRVVEALTRPCPQQRFKRAAVCFYRHRSIAEPRKFGTNHNFDRKNRRKKEDVGHSRR